MDSLNPSVTTAAHLSHSHLFLHRPHMLLCHFLLLLFPLPLSRQKNAIANISITFTVISLIYNPDICQSDLSSLKNFSVFDEQRRRRTSQGIFGRCRPSQQRVQKTCLDQRMSNRQQMSANLVLSAGGQHTVRPPSVGTFVNLNRRQ